MAKLALYVRLIAKPEKVREVEQFLSQAQELVAQESGTKAWFALHEDEGHYSIFDVFDDEAARDAHLNGPVAQALQKHGGDLFTEPPAIHRIQLLGSKL